MSLPIPILHTEVRNDTDEGRRIGIMDDVLRRKLRGFVKWLRSVCSTWRALG